MQVNFGNNVNSGFVTLFFFRNGAGIDQYDLNIRATDPDRSRIRVLKTSAVIQFVEGTPSGDIGFANNDFQVRLVVTKSGANIVISQFWANASNPITNLVTFAAGNLTKLGGSMADIPQEFTSGEWGIEQHDNQGNAYLFTCGHLITVSNMPSGHKIQLDAQTAVVESGGVATITPDTLQLPIATVKFLDPSDGVLDTLVVPVTGGRLGTSAGGGLWGGGTLKIT